MVSRYQKRIPSASLRTGSGPLLDRIDIHVDVPRVEYDKLSDDRLGEPRAAIRGRVEVAHFQGRPPPHPVHRPVPSSCCESS
jgi:magnesium chelatase family protein